MPTARTTTSNAHRRLFWLPLPLFAMLGMVMGLGGYTFYYAEGHSYLSEDPKVCVNCHIMREQYDGWQKAGHHEVATCNGCHLPQSTVPKYLAKAKNGFWHSKGFTLQDFHEPIQITPGNARILQENCVRCHTTLVCEIRSRSLRDADDIQCVRCHRDVGHGPSR